MNSTIDQQFIEFVVKSLVSHPDDVSIVRTIDEKGVLLELTVNPEDLGRVIGKRGATAQSLRTLLRALGTKNEARYNLKIVDNGEPRPPRDYDNEQKPREDRPERNTPARVSNDEHTDLHTEEVEQAHDQPEVTVADASQEENDHSDAISKTRAELDELDDLDI